MDDTDLAAASWPSLTSVSLGSAERGKAAAELLLDRLRNGDREPRLVTVPPALVVRASTAGEPRGAANRTAGRTEAKAARPTEVKGAGRTEVKGAGRTGAKGEMEGGEA
jgi:LacI family transcriptional regulator